MATFTIYHGKKNPMRAVGEHQCNLLAFAEKTRAWHYHANDRATKRAVAALVRKGYLEYNEYGQFRFKYPEG